MWENVAQPEKTDDNIVHVHFTVGTQGYKHTLSEYVNTYCFSSASMVVQMPLNIMFYVHCPSCLRYWEMFFCKDTHKGTQENCVVAAFLLPDK